MDDFTSNMQPTQSIDFPPLNFPAAFRYRVPQPNISERLIILPSVEPPPVVVPEPVKKPFVPAPAMTKRMLRIHQALIAHQRTHRWINLALRHEDALSLTKRRDLSFNLIMMVRSTFSDFLSGSRRNPIDIAALESPRGLAVKFAAEGRNGYFQIEMRETLPALRHLSRLVLEPRQLQECEDAQQIRMDALNGLLKLRGIF